MKSFLPVPELIHSVPMTPPIICTIPQFFIYVYMHLEIHILLDCIFALLLTLHAVQQELSEI